jgi:predicted nucleotidyltransferase
VRKVVSIRLDDATASAARAKARQQNRTLTNYIEATVRSDLQESASAGTPVRTPIGPIIRVIRDHRSDLERMGVRHVSVFGSIARGEERPDSDLDILIEVDPAVVKSLFAYGHIQQSIEEWMGRPVDVADKARLRPGTAAEAERDQIVAF